MPFGAATTFIRACEPAAKAVVGEKSRFHQQPGSAAARGSCWCNCLWVLKKSLRLAGEIWRKHVRRNHLFHALLDFHFRRTADHDGATRPLRSVVLLLPSGGSSS